MDSNTALLAEYLAPERPAIRRLRSLLTSYTDDSPGDEPLETAVCEAVRELRDAGAPPEMVVVALKALLEEAHIHPAGPIKPSALYEAAITWCIDEYFRSA
jgi:hypothetical protein